MKQFITILIICTFGIQQIAHAQEKDSLSELIDYSASPSIQFYSFLAAQSLINGSLLVPYNNDNIGERGEIGIFMLGSAANAGLGFLAKSKFGISPANIASYKYGVISGLIRGELVACNVNNFQSRRNILLGINALESFGMMGLTTALDLNHSQAQFVNFSTTIGFTTGFLLASQNPYKDNYFENTVSLSSYASTAIAYMLANNFKESIGDLSLIKTTTSIGLLTGLASGIDNSFDAFNSNLSILGMGVGAVGGYMLSKKTNLTKFQGRMVSLSAFGGGLLAPAITYVAASVEDAKTSMLVSALGASACTALLTRYYSKRNSNDSNQNIVSKF